MKCPICKIYELEIINPKVLYACPKCGLMSNADIQAWKKRHPANDTVEQKKSQEEEL